MNSTMARVLPGLTAVGAFLGVLLIGVSSSANADGHGSQDFTQRVYINGGVGITRIEPESSTDALTVSDNSDTGAHLGVGFDLNRFLSVEGYVADLGTADIDFLGTPAGTVDYLVFGASALGYLFNSRSGFVLGDNDAEGLFRREGLSLYGRLGIGHMRNDSSRVESNRDYPTHAAFGAGLEYGFRNGFALRTELMGMDTDARYLNVGILKRFGDVAVAAPPPVPTPKVALPAPLPVTPTAVTPEEPEVFRAILAPFIYFEFDKSALSAQAKEKLDVFAQAIMEKDLDIKVDGHTDWIAEEAYNVSLSIRRAEAVANYLIGKGMDASRITTMGYGEARPASTNDTAEGRRLNRRTEIVIQ
ncbi:MAG: OmpA family protein [Granulosicoccus sp.]